MSPELVPRRPATISLPAPQRQQPPVRQSCSFNPTSTKSPQPPHLLSDPLNHPRPPPPRQGSPSPADPSILFARDTSASAARPHSSCWPSLDLGEPALSPAKGLAATSEVCSHSLLSLSSPLLISAAALSNNPNKPPLPPSPALPGPAPVAPAASTPPRTRTGVGPHPTPALSP